MDQSISAFIFVLPIAATIGLVGMMTTIAIAVRRTRKTICPQRACREAAARAATGSPSDPGARSPAAIGPPCDSHEQRRSATTTAGMET